jgi:hypothetical protein
MSSSAGLNGGLPVLWTEWQNAVNPDGTPGPGGATHSTVTGFDAATGKLMATYSINGHVDGLTWDPRLRALIVTANEDNNSTMYLIDPDAKTVVNYTYSPNPAVSGNGGTDAVSLISDQIYVSHSNPNDTTEPALYSMTLDNVAHVANLTPVYNDNSSATDAVTGANAILALTDPDTNYVMPSISPRFGGDLALISQADGKIVFSSNNTGTPKLTVLTLTDNVASNAPPIDGLAVATSGKGTLFVVDAKGNLIQALDTTGWAAGTVFVTEPSDNHNPLLGTLNLSTGVITPLANTYVSPKGLFFVPAAGYQNVASDGGAFAYGAAPFVGSIGGKPLNKPVVGGDLAPDAAGLYEVASDGGIFCFGSAGFYGSMGGKPLNQPVVGMAASPDKAGYWIVATDGGIFAFGSAGYFGSMGGRRLNQPIVGMATTPQGNGYWLVAADGGVFSFGTANFYGSTGAIRLNKPIVAVAATPDGGGYWLVASDGGVFAFGDAQFLGSEGGTPINKPVVGMAAGPVGGYWLVASDGGVFSFGVPFLGSTGAIKLNQPVVGMSAT